MSNPRAQEIARLRAAARDLRAESEALLDAGDAPGALRAIERALLRDEIADALEGAAALPGPLQNTKRSPKVGSMTAAQRRERAGAIGTAQAEPGDKFQAAIRASKWGSANRYARERLKVSPAMLSRYRAGDYTVPENVAVRVLEDLGVKLGK